MSLEATQTALTAQAAADADHADNDRRTNAIGSAVVTIVIIIAGLLAVLLIGKFARGLWRSRALNPKPGTADHLPMTPAASAASASVVDAVTGDVGPRFAVIEYDDDPQSLQNILKVLYEH